MHTHKGTCQVCASVQAIDNKTRLMAKHGYVVKGWGFFNGTCPGATHKPAELDLTLTNSTIAYLTNCATSHDEHAKQYRTIDDNGSYHLRVESYVDWSHIPRGNVTRHITNSTPQNVIDREQEKAALTEETNARHTRSHIDKLVRYVIPRFDRPLIPNKSEAKIEFKTGYEFTTATRRYKLTRPAFAVFGNRRIGWFAQPVAGGPEIRFTTRDLNRFAKK